MSLLIGDKYTERLLKLCENTSSNILIFSAFVRSEALKSLSAHIDKDIDVSVIGRWNKSDLLFGASDLEVYNICKENNWRFGIDLSLHGKLLMFDYSKILLGSANITNKGLSLWVNGNIEFGVEFSAKEIDVNKLKELVSQICWVDDDLFLKLKDELSIVINSNDNEINNNWSSDIRESIEVPVCYLWVNELLFSAPLDLIKFNFNDKNKIHDYELLDLSTNDFTKQKLIEAFRCTHLYSWSRNLLDNNQEMNFGAISNMLHNSLLDDPLPYRKRVKEFVTVLFEWFKYMSDDFEVTKYNRTSSVKLKYQYD